MIETRELLQRIAIEPPALQAWIEAGWLRPRHIGGSFAFEAIDLARAELIHDLIHDLGVNDEGVSIALSLVDQIHDLRRVLRNAVRAVHEEDAATRARIVAAIWRARAENEAE
jgi:chaperone modulatory protein CbpM